jgi:hypothetical protein
MLSAVVGAGIEVRAAVEVRAGVEAPAGVEVPAALRAGAWLRAEVGVPAAVGATDVTAFRASNDPLHAPSTVETPINTTTCLKARAPSAHAGLLA